MIEKIYNCETNEVIEKELSKKEVDAIKKVIADVNELNIKIDKQIENKKAIYKKLGLTDDEIAAIL